MDIKNAKSSHKPSVSIKKASLQGLKPFLGAHFTAGMESPPFHTSHS
jgi:hypothetical protein